LSRNRRISRTTMSSSTIKRLWLVFSRSITRAWGTSERNRAVKASIQAGRAAMLRLKVCCLNGSSDAP
jgi:hypothetical protein